MRINKKQLAEIVDLIHDWSDFDVEVSGYHDYDITPYIPTSMHDDLLEEVNKIIKKRKWWRFW